VENGLSLKRVDSPLQPATASASADAAAHVKPKRNPWAMLAIGTHTHTQYRGLT
jgi:hypothetical protein